MRKKIKFLPVLMFIALLTMSSTCDRNDDKLDKDLPETENVVQDENMESFDDSSPSEAVSDDSMNSEEQPQEDMSSGDMENE